MIIPENDGAQALIAAGPAAEVARRLEVSERTVQLWRAGRVPSAESRTKIEAGLGIPPAAFDRAPEARTAPAAAAADASGLAPLPAAPDTGLSGNAAAIARLRGQLARIQAQRAAGGLSVKAALDLEALELRASAALASAEGGAVTQAQLLGSPIWARTRDAIVTALKPWPGAQRAVADAIEGLV